MICNGAARQDAALHMPGSEIGTPGGKIEKGDASAPFSVLSPSDRPTYSLLARYESPIRRSTGFIVFFRLFTRISAEKRATPKGAASLTGRKSAPRQEDMRHAAEFMVAENG